MLYEVFVYAQRSGGIVALEQDVEDPAGSPIFSRYAEFLRDTVTRDFICDSLRMLIIGATSAHELDLLMDLDIDVQRRGRQQPVNALSSVADSLPGLGIVAAVLGVVITMEAIGGSPETIGQKVAAALVGTFLGILLCYGVVSPVAARLENMGEAHTQFFQVMRIAIVSGINILDHSRSWQVYLCLVSYARGSAPILAIEYARRSIPVEMRPSFPDMETSIKREAKIPTLPKPGDAGSPESEASDVLVEAA